MALDARAGVMRAGASRANAYRVHNVVVTVNGAALQRYVQFNTLHVGLNLNDEPDTATFQVRPGPLLVERAFTDGFTEDFGGLESVELTVGQTCQIGLGTADNLEFAGQIVRLTHVFQKTITGPLRYTLVEAVDWGRLLDRRLVTAEFVNQSATDIAIAILANNTSGFTWQAVAPNLPAVDRFPVTNETVQGALKRLANLIEGGFYVDAYRDVHLFGAAGDAAPNAGTNPQPLTETLWSLQEFQDKPDITQQRTRVVVEGKSTTCPTGSPGALPGEVATSGVVDYLLVAGGAYGGSFGICGGGGGGGVKEGSSPVVSGAYPIVVGAGGASFNANGANSSALGIVAIGGGSGANDSGPGAAGGCGGGGCGNRGALQGGGAGTAGQGYAGGVGGYWFSTDTEDFYSVGGGGGGAGGVGGNGQVNLNDSGVPGAGGIGHLSSISGTPTYYGGGGAGGSGAGTAAGGLGGGGTAGVAGTDGLGGGGGASARGGSGRVTISYRTGDFTATGGTVTTSGSRTIHTFTADDTFTVLTVAVTLPASAITSFPITDASQIEQGAGIVRAGNAITPYTAVLGPVLAEGQNAPGTKLTADAIVGAATLAVESDATTVITDSSGWVKVGDQYVRFAGVSATALTIPTEGYGSLGGPVSSGAAVTWIGALAIPSTTFDPPFAANAEVVQRLTVDDASAQTDTAAIEGGDGVHEHLIADNRLSLTAAEDKGSADLAMFSAAAGVDEAEWQTRDLNARPGRQQAVGFGGITSTLLIIRVEITYPVPDGLPFRSCSASSLKQPGLYDVIVTQRS